MDGMDGWDSGIGDHWLFSRGVCCVGCVVLCRLVKYGPGQVWVYTERVYIRILDLGSAVMGLGGCCCLCWSRCLDIGSVCPRQLRRVFLVKITCKSQPCPSPVSATSRQNMESPSARLTDRGTPRQLSQHRDSMQSQAGLCMEGNRGFRRV
jgi:hypothetical protein